MLKDKKRLSEAFKKASESEKFMKLHTAYKGAKQLATLGLGKIRNQGLKLREKISPPSPEDRALKIELEKPYYNFDILYLDEKSLDFLKSGFGGALSAHRVFPMERQSTKTIEEFVFKNCISDALVIGEEENALSEFLRGYYGFRFLSFENIKDLANDGKSLSNSFRDLSQGFRHHALLQSEKNDQRVHRERTLLERL